MDEEGSNWKDRCERYFTSLTDSDKQRQKDQKMQSNEWKSLGAKSNNSKRAKMQYWLRALDIHGLHFAGSTRNSLECAVWFLIALVSAGGLVFMLYLSINGYINQDNYLQLKSSTLSNKRIPSTYISICNLNVFKRSKLLQSSRLSKLANIDFGSFNPQQYSSAKLLLETKEIWPILQRALGGGIDDFVSDLNHDFLPYAGMTKSDDWESLYGASKTYGFEIWRDAVNPSLSEIRQFGHQPNDMVVQCRESNGRDCQSSVTTNTDQDLGNCATLNASSYTDFVSLILNVEPQESVPVLTPSNGLGVFIFSSDQSIDQSSRHVVSPANHLIIRNRKVASITRTTDCSETGNPRVCERSCLDILTFKYCQCHTDRQTGPQCQVNDKFQYVCPRTVKKLLSMGSLECDCKPKCSETKFETTGSTLPWPSNEYLEHLESSLLGQGFNKSSIQSSLAYVTIFLQPEVYEEINESRLTSLLDLLSQIGGLSALFVGMSIISVFQLLWLLVKFLFNTAIKRRAEPTMEIENIASSEITSITWQAYKDRHKEQRPNRFTQPDLKRNGRPSHLAPIEEERKSNNKRTESKQDFLEDQLFSHPWERSGLRRPYTTVINSNHGGGEFPLFNYVDYSRTNSPMPRCSTPDNSDYRSTARLMPAEGDVSLFPSRNKHMSPADAIKTYGTPSPSKYQYSGPYYL